MTKSTGLPEGLSVRTVAEQLNCCPATIRRNIREGLIPVIRVTAGRRLPMLRIPREWLEKTMRGYSK